MSSGRIPLQDLQWPNNARVAVTVSVVIEVWSENATPGANSPGGFLSGGVKVSHTRDIRVEKMVEYGTNVGAWKLLEILDQERVKASVLLSGRAAELYPDLVRRYHESGHEIVGHSYAQDISTYDFKDPEEERKNVRRTTEAIERVTGVRPVGWISPRVTPSPFTLDVLAEEGYLWCGDYPDDELPYLVKTPAGTIVVIPHSGIAGVNDHEIALTNGNPPRVYMEIFRDTFDYLYQEAARTGSPGMLRIQAHAHVYGRPWGRLAFREAIRHAKAPPNVWFATRAKIAEWALERYGR